LECKINDILSIEIHKGDIIQINYKIDMGYNILIGILKHFRRQEVIRRQEAKKDEINKPRRKSKWNKIRI